MWKNALFVSASVGVTVGILAAVLIAAVVVYAACLKRCPADKIMVVYGAGIRDENGKEQIVKCVHGGAVFVVPFLQRYAFLDLAPLSVGIELSGAPSAGDARVSLSSVFTFGVSVAPDKMPQAAQYLLGLPPQNVAALAKEILLGQLRLAVAETAEFEENTDGFLSLAAQKAENELGKIGLDLLNINIERFETEKDNSGGKSEK